MFKSLNIADLVDSTTGMLKVRLYVYLTNKFEYTKTAPDVMIQDALNVFKDDEVIPLIEEWTLNS